MAQSNRSGAHERETAPGERLEKAGEAAMNAVDRNGDKKIDLTDAKLLVGEAGDRLRKGAQYVMEGTEEKTSEPKRFFSLLLLFAIVIGCVALFNLLPKKNSAYTDAVAEQLVQEMNENKIVFGNGYARRRTVVEFQEPIISSHGAETRLEVYKVELKENASVSKEGLFGWGWTSAYQDLRFTGIAKYTVDLSQLTGDDFTVNNEMKQVTVRIPYAELELTVPGDLIEFQDVKRGWLGAKEIGLTVEQSAQLYAQASSAMKSRLIDENTIQLANDNAKQVVTELLTATVHAVDPEYEVIVVQ